MQKIIKIGLCIAILSLMIGCDKESEYKQEWTINSVDFGHPEGKNHLQIDEPKLILLEVENKWMTTLVPMIGMEENNDCIKFVQSGDKRWQYIIKEIPPKSTEYRSATLLVDDKEECVGQIEAQIELLDITGVLLSSRNMTISVTQRDKSEDYYFDISLATDEIDYLGDSIMERDDYNKIMSHKFVKQVGSEIGIEIDSDEFWKTRMSGMKYENCVKEDVIYEPIYDDNNTIIELKSKRLEVDTSNCVDKIIQFVAYG
jgi:hypothetical protein